MEPEVPNPPDLSQADPSAARTKSHKCGWLLPGPAVIVVVNRAQVSVLFSIKLL
jgi:hypothetical protein